MEGRQYTMKWGDSGSALYFLVNIEIVTLKLQRKYLAQKALKWRT